MRYAVIMAGGRGQRLWPLSRQKRPKQVLRLFDGKTLLRLCYERLEGLFEAPNILVVTNASYVDTVRQDLPEIPAGNVIGEPAVRDTSGAIGLAASILAKKDSEASMAVVTADQIISPAEPLRHALEDALSFVEDNPRQLVVFGIKPAFPSTQLGYVQLAEPAGTVNKSRVFKVERFREKPNEQTAAEYIEAGNFMWNSGMFVWRARTILDELGRFAPETKEPLQKIADSWDTQQRQAAVDEWFVKLPKISIDYAVMERATNVSAIKLDCRWLDLGCFTALADVIRQDATKNVIIAAQNALLDCRENIVVTEDQGHLIAAIGLENTVIVHSPDATLVCPASQAHRLKELLEKMQNEGKAKYL
jgi:mannose-1-phosphate guanylyltransferase